MKYKLLVSDFDNTLYGSDHTVSKRNFDVIAEYERRGGKFVICTGRMTEPAAKRFSSLGFGGEMIGYQGGETYNIDSGEYLSRKFMKDADALELLGCLEKWGFYTQFYSGPNLFVNRITSRTQRYCAENIITMPTVVGNEMSAYVRSNALKLNKIVFGLTDDAVDADYAEFKKQMVAYYKMFGGRMEFNSSNLNMIEVISTGNSKGVAVLELAARLGISREEVICIGDGSIDLSMIECAGLGVAVDNATFDVKAAADVITVSCDCSAVAEVIEKYCFSDAEGFAV